MTLDAALSARAAAASTRITLPDGAQLESLSINGSVAADPPGGPQGDDARRPRRADAWRSLPRARPASGVCSRAPPSILAPRASTPRSRSPFPAGAGCSSRSARAWAPRSSSGACSSCCSSWPSRWDRTAGRRLRAWHWALLFVGLSQVDVVAGLFFVGWLLALGYRARDEHDRDGRGLVQPAAGRSSSPGPWRRCRSSRCRSTRGSSERPRCR